MKTFLNFPDVPIPNDESCLQDVSDEATFVTEESHINYSHELQGYLTETFVIPPTLLRSGQIPADMFPVIFVEQFLSRPVTLITNSQNGEGLY